MLSVGARALGALYRWFISPTLHLFAGAGMGCRFEPTCGAYAETALREHGILKGAWYALTRVLRCNPWGGAGFDPVPPSKR